VSINSAEIVTSQHTEPLMILGVIMNIAMFVSLMVCSYASVLAAALISMSPRKSFNFSSENLR
jgi:hypothetical protein